MGYLHIDNLYRNTEILDDEQVYELEKVHGTSAHIRYDGPGQPLVLFSGGAKAHEFQALFDLGALQVKLENEFGAAKAIVYGEAFGGRVQKMPQYGPSLRFVAFDVYTHDMWMDVPEASKVCSRVGLDFIPWSKISSSLEAVNSARDAMSTISLTKDAHREGIVIRPLHERNGSNGKRLIAKHKRPEHSEMASYRELDGERMLEIQTAKAVAAEFVTANRLVHVLDKLPDGCPRKVILDAMYNDIKREAAGEYDATIPENDIRFWVSKATCALLGNLFKNEKI
jgi:hypothetical protein